MATVHLDQLQCLRTTGGGADDTYAKIFIDGKYKSRWPDRGDRDMNRGDRARINRSYNFNHEIKVELWEYDSGSGDDYMGSCKISSRESGHNSKTIANRSEGDEYRLSYDVTKLRHITIDRVQCLAPASGITNWTRGIFGTVAGIIATGVTVAGASVTGGATLAATASAAGKAVSGTLTALSLIDGASSGTDELYIKINGEKVWPTHGKYQDVKALKPFNPNINKPFKGDKVVIELMEYDSGSGDDLLARLVIDTHKFNKDRLHDTFITGNTDEGSLYEIHLGIA